MGIGHFWPNTTYSGVAFNTLCCVPAGPVSVAQECLDDAGDTDAGVNVDGAELMDQPPSVDGSEKLALDVAGLVEAILAGWLQFDMERESSSGRRQRSDDHEREPRAERIRWAKY